MLQRLREFLTLALIALLPFHAFLVTVKTRFLLGPGYAPMGEIAVWKEVVLALILLIAVTEIAFSFQLSAFRKKIDVLDVLIACLTALGIFVSVNYQLSTINFLYGFRYDFIPLIAFVILRRLPWSDLFLKRVMNVLLGAGAVVASYGIVSFFLPAGFFTWLGYSDLHSLYLPEGPLAPFQQIGGTSLRRIQSVMSGPNQLGLWLLIPIAVVVSKFSIFHSPFSVFLKKYGLLTMLLLGALLLSFSRAAWIGAAVIVTMVVWPSIKALPKQATVALVSFILLVLTAVALFFPSVILRAASSRGHIENPLRAIQTMVDHPLGLGLGTAGPASNRTSDACVMLEEGSDASWAADRADLCVFVGQTQVQPTDRTCNCPFLPENWYLQIGVEMGWIGMVLYLMLIGVVIYRLWNDHKASDVGYQTSVTHAMIALSIAALFLHAWEDAAVAYTVWILMSVVLPPPLDRH